MAQIMLNNNYNYELQIHHLRTQGDVLLQQIKSLEIRMNRRKQQNQEASPQNLNSLHAMVKKLLHMLSTINTYEYFKIMNVPFSCINDNYFNQVCNNNFNILIQRFITKLRLRRLRRLQNLQQSLQQINHFIEPVDFKIWQ